MPKKQFRVPQSTKPLSGRGRQFQNKVPMGIVHPSQAPFSLHHDQVHFLAKTSLPPVLEPLLARHQTRNCCAAMRYRNSTDAIWQRKLLM
jgi:hypothetical protein